ncbi:MAG TPA: class I SAM-dependent methyltransferase [Ramlibacter sp.]|uniref:class I SAM-dependent methyltransferase n=1 Tax=Ramlibacter sp. TaxID=1917967 RepID=UPI002D7EA8F0|nr:class I SAM-dependent methyltransferase [Ramlibacter sp.]HET8744965.1 class I SAM-dependent methyltransferase [Ramlibacter sp.]
MKPIAALARERLRASPNFVLAFSQDGRPYVAQETEPYLQFWLSQRYRILLSLFSGPKGATGQQAVDAYFRLTAAEPQEAERNRLLKAVADMRQAGVLIGTRDDVSRYDARMAQDYLTHRPFPPQLARFIVQQGGIGPDTRVLDLAGGPGSLALQFARVSPHVALMDLSRGFVQAARDAAAGRGLALDAIHESANRLMYSDEQYDVVTLSQAIHWLDDVLVCRGIARVLAAGGSFFVIQSSMDLDDAHPLAYVLGRDSVLGRKDAQPFPLQVQALARRLSLLFEALDAPDVQRHDPTQRFGAEGGAPPPRVVPSQVSFFRQRRPFDIGYARAFLSDEHIRPTGLTPGQFWAEAEARCAAATPQQLEGHFDWGVLHFCRGGAPGVPADFTQCAVAPLGWEPVPV